MNLWQRIFGDSPRQPILSVEENEFMRKKTDEERLAKLPPELKTYSINTRHYKRDEAGKWIADEERNRQEAEAQLAYVRRVNRNADLVWAMRSRVLTDEELAEVNEQRDQLLTMSSAYWWTGYKQADITKQMNDLLLQQFNLRMIAASARAKKES